MCRWHFSVVLFMCTDFNCFLKSIRRSIPTTGAVKSTSTRRFMTCNFSLRFLRLSQREIWPVAVICRREPTIRLNAHGSWSYLCSHSRDAHSNLTGEIDFGRRVTTTHRYRWRGRGGISRVKGNVSWAY